MIDNAVEVTNVWKTFRIFQKRNTTLKQALLNRGKDNFEEFWALRDVSFEIPAGSSFGIVGANGAGKSTMLKTLSRILVPDRGAVKVNGRIAALLELGAGFHPEMSGRENVYLNGNILGMSTATLNSKFDEIVEFSGLQDFIDQPVKTYSSGMTARLGFSVAVAVEPDILLIDEALAVGDEQFQRRCNEKMSEIRSSGRTVILVSHGLNDIQKLCDRAVWLDKGTVKAVGKTNNVIDSYLSSVTTSYRIDDRGRERSGSGEIQLEVELLPNLAEQSVQTGNPLTVRMHWTSDQRIDNPALTLAVRNADGYLIGGSTNLSSTPVEPLGPGSGWFDFAIPAVPLLPGSYHISVAASDTKNGHTYDVIPKAEEFDVTPSGGRNSDQGAVSFFGQWTTGTNGK